MKLVPVPLDDEAIQTWMPHWLPFLPLIARRTKETVQALRGQITRREVRLTLIWDDSTGRPVALIGVRLHMRGPDLIAEIVWTTGHDYKSWLHLLPELEELLRLAGVVECRPICRPGWRKMLEAHGYKVTHLQMEKSIKEQA